VRAGELASIGLAHATKREREGERRDRVGADRWDPPVRQWGHASAGARGGWAKWAGLG
jgi:hypothetical protein